MFAGQIYPGIHHQRASSDLARRGCGVIRTTSLEPGTDEPIQPGFYNLSYANVGEPCAPTAIFLLRGLYNALPRSDGPITTPSLAVDCLKVLDDQPERYTPKLRNALSFFVAVMRRSDPNVFEEGPFCCSCHPCVRRLLRKIGGRGQSKARGGIGHSPPCHRVWAKTHGLDGKPLLDGPR